MCSKVARDASNVGVSSSVLCHQRSVQVWRATGGLGLLDEQDNSVCRCGDNLSVLIN